MSLRSNSSEKSTCPSTSAVTACKVSSGICLEAQAALPIELNVPQTQTGPVFVTLRR